MSDQIMETHAGITEPGPTVYRVTFAHEHSTLKEGDLVRVIRDPADNNWLSRVVDGSLHEKTGKNSQYVHLIELSKELTGSIKSLQPLFVRKAEAGTDETGATDGAGRAGKTELQPALKSDPSTEPEAEDEAKELSAIHEVRITSFDEKQTSRLIRIAETRADLRQAEIASMLKRNAFVAAFTNEEKARRCVNALRAVKGTSVAVATKEFKKSSK